MVVCGAVIVFGGHVFRHKSGSKKQGKKICGVGDKGGFDKGTEKAHTN